jgi:hypothetical protein
MGVGIRDPGSGKTYSGSRVQGQNPDPQQCLLVVFIMLAKQISTFFAFLPTYFWYGTSVVKDNKSL